MQHILSSITFYQQKKKNHKKAKIKKKASVLIYKLRHKGSDEAETCFFLPSHYVTLPFIAKHSLLFDIRNLCKTCKLPSMHSYRKKKKTETPTKKKVSNKNT